MEIVGMGTGVAVVGLGVAIIRAAVVATQVVVVTQVVVGGLVVALGGIFAAGLFADFWQQEKKIKQQAISKNDPKMYSQKMDQQADKLIGEYSLISGQQVGPESQQKNVAFFGATSSGKSSLINQLFNTKLEIGLGQTTESAKIVYQYQNIRIWDTVGENSTYQFLQPQKAELVRKMDIIFILYGDTIKSIKFMAKLICKTKGTKVYFVRTKCDQWNNSHGRTIDEELKSYGIEGLQILTSPTKVEKSQNLQTKMTQFFRSLVRNDYSCLALFCKLFDIND